MSLIHDALREQDGPALPVRPAPRASWWARQSPRARGTALFAAAGLGGFVLAGAVLLGLGGRGTSAMARVRHRASQNRTASVRSSGAVFT